MLPSDLDISMSELAEWTAYERLAGPILVHDRVEAMIARLCALLANIYSKGRRFEPVDFMLPREGMAAAQADSPERMIAAFESAIRSGG